MENYYKELMIWKYLDDTSTVRYCCLQNLRTGQYAVQNADFFRLPLDEKQFRQFAKQFVELFIEVSPDERCNWFDSVEEAIKEHEEYFS